MDRMNEAFDDTDVGVVDRGDKGPVIVDEGNIPGADVNANGERVDPADAVSTVENGDDVPADMTFALSRAARAKIAHLDKHPTLMDDVFADIRAGIAALRDRFRRV